MMVKIQFENQENIYEIPLKEVVKHIKNVTEEDFKTACSKAVALT